MKLKSVFSILALLALSMASHDATAEISLTRQVIGGAGLSDITVIGTSPGDATRIFVASKQGAINLIRQPVPDASPTRFLNVAGVNASGEGGLLGLAFHPDYSNNGTFWVYYTTGLNIVVARGQRSASNPDVANPTLTPILTTPQSTSFHVGGWIGFGVDGYLYISTGDGGNSSNAQNITNNLRGKILCIDVDGPDNIPGNEDDDAFPVDTNKNYSIPASNPFIGVSGDDEIFAYGLRNPWRCSVDRETGDLWIGDVGESLEEEIDVIPFGTSGQNFGWPCREGLSPHSCSIVPPPPSTQPWGAISRIPNSPPPYLPATGNYIVGGIVYRGNAIPCLQGQYVFSNGGFYIYSVWSDANNQPRFFRSQTALAAGNTFCFGEDASGELLYSANGAISRIVAGSTSGSDCNSNGVPNDCEIMMGLALDLNNNGIPDSCECDSIDFNNDTSVFDPQDIEAFLSVYSEGPCVPATATCNDIDFNNDGSVFDPADISAFLRVYSEGPCV